MNGKKFLRILWSALLIRYCAIYVPLLLVSVLSKNWSLLLPVTIYYWIAIGLLVIAEKWGSYTEIRSTQILQSYFFFKTTELVPVVCTKIPRR
jgi:hypothetical protein